MLQGHTFLFQRQTIGYPGKTWLEFPGVDFGGAYRRPLVFAQSSRYLVCRREGGKDWIGRGTYKHGGVQFLLLMYDFHRERSDWFVVVKDIVESTPGRKWKKELDRIMRLFKELSSEEG
jgi:hypothetical protein